MEVCAVCGGDQLCSAGASLKQATVQEDTLIEGAIQSNAIQCFIWLQDLTVQRFSWNCLWTLVFKFVQVLNNVSDYNQ